MIPAETKLGRLIRVLKAEVDRHTAKSEFPISQARAFSLVERSSGELLQNREIREMKDEYLILFVSGSCIERFPKTTVFTGYR